jgi:hypothetical protein
LSRRVARIIAKTRSIIAVVLARTRFGLRGRTEPILIAVLVVGFAWALASALNELDAAVKDASASLATIATIGNQVPD